MREAQALQDFLLQQGERLQRLQLGHQQPEVQVRSFCLLDLAPRLALYPWIYRPLSSAEYLAGQKHPIQ